MKRLLVAVCCLGACGKSASKPAVRLITDDEIASFEAALMKRIADRKTRRCERPLLRGAPANSTATADMLAVVENAELVACGKRVSRARSKGVPLWSSQDPEVVAIAKDCGSALEAAVTKAVSHLDACSPYQVGVYGGLPDPSGMASRWTTTLQLTHLLGFLATRRAETDPAGALWLLLDGIRFADDLARGDIALLDLMTATAAERMLAERALAILGEHPPADAELPKLAAAVDALLASQPRFGDVLLAERDVMDMEYALAPLKPKAWTPPGGWYNGADPRGAGEGSRIETKRFAIDPKDEHALMFLVGEAQGAARAKACPPSATLEQCAAELARPARPNTVTPADVDKLYDELARAKSQEDARSKIRDAVVQILLAVAEAQLGDYAKKRAQAVAMLATLRIHLELLRDARATKQCPPVLVDLPAGVVEPPGLGGRFTIAPGKDSVAIEAPAWIGAKEKPAPFRCPAP